MRSKLTTLGVWGLVELAALALAWVPETLMWARWFVFMLVQIAAAEMRITHWTRKRANLWEAECIRLQGGPWHGRH